MNRRIGFLVAAACLVGTACDSNHNAQQPKVWVYEAIAALDGTYTYQPVANAQVNTESKIGDTRAVYGGMTFAEGSSDLGFDLTNPASVTVRADGFVLLTVQGITREFLDKPQPNGPLAHPGDLVLVLSRAGAPSVDTVTLSGTIAGKSDPNNFVGLQAKNGASFFQDRKTTYGLEVQRGEPIEIVGYEFSLPARQPVRGTEQHFARWFTASAPAATDATTLNLDLATLPTLTPKQAHAEIVIPGGDGGPLGGNSYSFFRAHNGNQSVSAGFVTKTGPNADGSRFLIDTEWVEPTSITDPGHYFGIASQNGNSFYFKRGYPTGDVVIEDMPLPPLVNLEKATVGDVIKPLDLPTDRASFALRMEVNDEANQPVWQIGNATADEFAIADLPDDFRATLPAKLYGFFVLTMRNEADPKVTRLSGSRTIELELP